MDELQNIQSKIYEIRGQRVMLDFDLAELYQVETRVLNQSVKRNIRRFPDDFMFQLTDYEWQIISSQFVMTSRVKRPKSALPLAFTEHGALALAGVLRSEVAIETSIFITRAFVAMRQALTTLALPSKIVEIERSLKDLRQDIDDILHDQNDINEATRAQLDAISTALAELQSKEPRQKPRRPIGFVTCSDDEGFTPPYRLNSLLSTRYIKTAFSLMRGGKAAVWLGLVLLCLFSSCSKDDVESEYTIEDLYTESQTLQYQTPDSVESFKYKFYWYLEAHPDAQDHPYYTEIDKKIDEISPKCIVVDTDWEGEQHLEY